MTGRPSVKKYSSY